MCFFSMCVTGIRIQTTHAGSLKWKYTVWGVSEKSANRKQFDVTDEGTGRTYKTTVADYFKDRYRLILRCELQMIYITCRLSFISTSGRAYCRVLANFARVCRPLEGPGTKNESPHNFPYQTPLRPPATLLLWRTLR